MKITAPLDGAEIPADMAALTIRWEASSCESGGEGISAWRVEMEVEAPADQFGDETVEFPDRVVVETEGHVLEWRPTAAEWSGLREQAGSRRVRVAVRGVAVDSGAQPCTAEDVRFSFSADRFGAAVFYREVPLPLAHAMDRLQEIRWRLGWVSSRDEPATVLTDMVTCANCHSFSSAGTLMAIDVDYGSDKGSFAVTEIAPETVIDADRLISWNDDRHGWEGRNSFGLLPRLSPDGCFVASTVREVTVHRPLPDPANPQLFFPVRGVLAIHDRRKGSFFTLGGADRPDMVQTNPVWSPDQRWIVFARAEALPLDENESGPSPAVPRALIEELVNGRRDFRFDLYRVPFNEGRGGHPKPLLGASHNGRSNFFPAVSPDGRWLVFCQASNFMFNQPDATLYIMPADGGQPRRMTCNFDGRMNSWHSFSPNGRWLIFSAKADGPYTQLWLTHIDEHGRDSVPVRLDGFVRPRFAANLPELVDLQPGHLRRIRISGDLR